MPQLPDSERFWSRVSRGDESSCWNWTGSVTKTGYGMCSVRGCGWKSATHVVWLLTHGCWPSRWILHHCDNPTCVNPKHLYEGGPSENQRDAYARGRRERINAGLKKAHMPRAYCKQGHELAVTARRRNDGGRQCRVCQSEANRRLYVAQRAERLRYAKERYPKVKAQRQAKKAQRQAEVPIHGAQHDADQ